MLLLVNICVISRLGLLWACYKHSWSCALEHVMHFSKKHPLECKCYITGFDFTINYIHDVGLFPELYTFIFLPILCECFSCSTSLYHLTLLCFLVFLFYVLPHHGCNLHFLIMKDVESIFIWSFSCLFLWYVSSCMFMICLWYVSSFWPFLYKNDFFPINL